MEGYRWNLVGGGKSWAATKDMRWGGGPLEDETKQVLSCNHSQSTGSDLVKFSHILGCPFLVGVPNVDHLYCPGPLGK